MPDAAFQLADDQGTGTLADYRGKVVLVNFWATWCAPCRKEMPGLQALQDEFGGDRFQVVTIATGRNSPDGIKRFFDEAGVTSLPSPPTSKCPLLTTAFCAAKRLCAL